MTCESLLDTIHFTQISVSRTDRRAATGMEAPLLFHSWQDRIISIRMK